MRKLLLAAALLLPLIGHAQDQSEYQVQKLVKLKAENACLLLANVTLHTKDFRALAIHIEPETKGLEVPDRDGYFIVTAYKYRLDGVAFACVFRDFRTDGLIQLTEFGHVVDGGEDVMTIVKPLF
jgi:hypothetical protein